MRYTDTDLLEHLASAYVLGTLAHGARRRFERLQRDRADVRERVAQWEARLGQLAVSVSAQKPPASVWAAIAARTRPASASKPRTSNERSASWLNWFRPAAFGVGGLTTGLIVASVVFMTAPTLFLSTDQLAMQSGEKLPQSYVGLLTDTQGNGKLLVSSLRHGKTMTIKVIGPITPPTAGRLVLWALPANGPAFSLGNVPTSGSAASVLPDVSEKLLSKVSKLVVTLETDADPVKPADAVVFSGNCAKLW